MAPDASLKPPSDETIAAVSQAQDLVFVALQGRSNFVRIMTRIAGEVTNLSARAFVPSVVAATDCLLGPIQFDAVTQLNEEGASLNTASNVTGAMICNLAPCASPALAPR